MADERVQSEEKFRADEIEYALLGAVLSDSTLMAVARPLLAHDAMGLPGHAIVWSALCEAFDAGHAVDLASLRVALRERNRINTVEGQVRLAPLEYMPASIEHVTDWCRAISAHNRARRVRSVLAACVAKADEGLSAADFAHAVREAINRAANEGERNDESWLDEDMDRLQRRLESVADGSVGGAMLSTGLEGLDRLLCGLRGGQVYVLAGRTAQGKTALAATIALNNALLAAASPVLFASLEMTAEDMAGRAIAWLSGVPQSLIRAGDSVPLDANTMQATSLASGAIRRRIRMITGADLTVGELRARARRLRAERGLSLVVVDYLQLMRSEGVGNKQSREREVAEISRGVKRLALELNVPVLALSQLNREADASEKPELKHLRESGSIEQDATAVVFLWPGKDPDTVRLVVAKSRFGAQGEALARFDRPLTRFEDVRDSGVFADASEPYAVGGWNGH